MFKEITKFWCKNTVPNTANCPCKAKSQVGGVDNITGCTILSQSELDNIAPLMKEIEIEFKCAGLCDKLPNFIFHNNS
jgi:hypothetical protein